MVKKNKLIIWAKTVDCCLLSVDIKIMKKTLLLTLALLLSFTILAQEKKVFVKENFDSTTLPQGWMVYGIGTPNWRISLTDRAGGECNELMLYFDPGFNGASYFAYKSKSLKEVEEVAVSFKHYLDNFSGSSRIGIATSSDNGKTWNEAWSETYSKTGNYIINEVISTPDMGKSNVKFALFFEGDSYNLYSWHFDDLEIFVQENLDLRIVSIDIPEIAEAGETEVKFTVQNIGKETVNSFTIESPNITDSYCGTTYPETFETELAPFETKQFTLKNTFNLNPGNYNIPITITEVNGNSDNDITDNYLSKDFAVTMGSTQRIPLIEHFSSSTCGPCKDVNINMNTLTANNPGKYTYVKYPLSFPYPGDPYNTEDAKVRTTYYGVTSAPHLFLDGINQGFGAIKAQNFEAQYNVPAYVNIKGAFDVDYDSIRIVADFMSYVDINNVRVFASVNEKTTTKNVSENGETEFHHISLTMPDNAEGRIVNIKAGEYYRMECTLNITETFMEDIGDLEVALWIQNYETKEVYNSRYAYDYTSHCYPIQNLTINVKDNERNVTWNAPEKGNPIGYNVYVNNELVLENTTELSYNTTSNDDVFFVEVVALYENDKTSVGLAKKYAYGDNIDEQHEIQCKVYPNPVNDRLYIETQTLTQTQTIEIYDIYGRRQVTVTASHQGNLTIDVENLKSGIYFVKINTEKGNIVKRIIKD